MVKIGRKTAEPSVRRAIGEVSVASTAETPQEQLQDLVRRTMPPGLGSLGWIILATMVLARLNTLFESEKNLKDSFFSKASRSSAHSSACVTGGDSVVSVLMWSREVEPLEGVSA